MEDKRQNFSILEVKLIYTYEYIWGERERERVRERVSTLIVTYGKE